MHHAMSRWEQYLYAQHSRETLRAWARRLELFRFVRDFGGIASDGDSLDVAFRYDSEPQLLGFFGSVRLEPVVHPVLPPQPEPGRSYSSEAYNAFPPLIPGTRWIEQPGHCVLFGVRAFVWCRTDRITVSIYSGYEVTEEDVERAAGLEPHLKGVLLDRIEPPADRVHCICPKYHPELFA